MLKPDIGIIFLFLQHAYTCHDPGCAPVKQQQQPGAIRFLQRLTATAVDGTKERPCPLGYCIAACGFEGTAVLESVLLRKEVKQTING